MFSGKASRTLNGKAEEEIIFSCEGAALEVLMAVRPSVHNQFENIKLLKVPEVSLRFRLLKVPEGSGDFPEGPEGS